MPLPRAWSSFGFLGRARKRIVFIGIRRIAIQKKSVPKFFDSKSMPPSWAWSSLGFWADLAADRFLLEPAESPSKIFRPRKCLIANPCRCHGHGHRSGLGGACLRTVFIRIRRIALPKKSVPKNFDSQSMPPPWA